MFVLVLISMYITIKVYDFLDKQWQGQLDTS